MKVGRDADGGGGSFNRGSEKPFFFLGAQKVADLPGRTPFCDGSKEEEVEGEGRNGRGRRGRRRWRENIYLSLNEGDNDGKGIFGRGKL